MIDKLTNKDIEFCNLIINGLTIKQSYRQVFDIDNKYTENTIQVNSSKLYNTPKIQKYINDIKDKENNKLFNNLEKEKEKFLNEIYDRITYCKSINDDNNLTKYYKLLVQIYGINTSSNQIDNDDKLLNNLDLNGLKTLLNVS